jgi:hypothetical protein
MLMYQQLLGVNNLSLPQNARQQSIRLLSDRLQHLQRAVHSAVKAQVKQAVSFAQAVLALDSVFNSEFKSSSAVIAVCTWLRYRGLEQESVQLMQTRHWTYGSLWNSEEDCDWWQQQIARNSSLQIKGMNHLLVLVQRRKSIAEAHGDGDAKHKFWLDALTRAHSSANELDSWIDQARQYYHDKAGGKITAYGCS